MNNKELKEEIYTALAKQCLATVRRVLLERGEGLNTSLDGGELIVSSCENYSYKQISCPKSSAWIETEVFCFGRTFVFEDDDSSPDSAFGYKLMKVVYADGEEVDRDLILSWLALGISFRWLFLDSKSILNVAEKAAGFMKRSRATPIYRMLPEGRDRTYFQDENGRLLFKNEFDFVDKSGAVLDKSLPFDVGETCLCCPDQLIEFAERVREHNGDHSASVWADE